MFILKFQSQVSKIRLENIKKGLWGRGSSVTLVRGEGVGGGLHNLVFKSRVHILIYLDTPPHFVYTTWYMYVYVSVEGRGWGGVGGGGNFWLLKIENTY